MFIYKITNTINNKIYIGQVYNKTIYDRFARHIKEASPTHPILLDRAIYKYGGNNFIIEQIDEATTLSELNEKEKYWIKYYNSTNRNIGYNLTPGGNGGNTYLNKTEDELKQIKEKISKANKGKNNGQSKSLKGYNIKTGEILYFDTFAEACSFFNYKHKQTFAAHCNNKATYLWRNEWTFAYTDNEFITSLLTHDPSTKKGTKIKLIDLSSGYEECFNSLNKLYNKLQIKKGMLKFIDNVCVYNHYKIIKL
jgi:group I intron endonuclease